MSYDRTSLKLRYNLQNGGATMDENIDKKFSDFLDSKKADKIYDKFQTSLKQAFIEGYKAGQKIIVQIVYIKIKK